MTNLTPLTSNPSFLNLKPVPSILGDQILTSSSHHFAVTRAESGEIHQVVGCSVEQAVQAADVAAKALPEWKKTSYSQRSKIFLRAAEILKERAEEFININVEEGCLDLGFANFELHNLAVAHLEDTAATVSAALKGEFPRIDTESGRRELIQREPFGVVLGISPWNAPVVLSLRAVLYPLAAGNTVILKTSEQSPRTNMIIVEALYQAGLPPGVLSCIHASTQNVAEVTTALIQHKAVRKINFTGSTRVGRIVAGEAAKVLKPCVLELGGKAPMVILKMPEEEVKIAANNALIAHLLNTSQVCMSLTNVFVHKSIEEVFLKEVSKLWKEHRDEIYFYNKGSQKGKVRALFSSASAKNAHAVLHRALEQGAKVHAGGEEELTDLEHARLAPTVVSGLTPKMDLLTTEVFAPVLGVATFETIEEAVSLANASDYGLAAAVYGSDETEAYQVASQIEAGQVHINSITVADTPEVPHGGWKSSGYGRFNGVAGIQEFSQTRCISISRPQALPFFIL